MVERARDWFAAGLAGRELQSGRELVGLVRRQMLQVLQRASKLDKRGSDLDRGFAVNADALTWRGRCRQQPDRGCS